MMKTERQERIQDKYEFEKARVVEGKGIARELRRLEGKRCGESGLFFFFFSISGQVDSSNICSK